MHHSQLEYLVAVQKLQRQDRGAKGYEVAEYLNVSPAYAVKLNVYAESQGYVLRDKARTIRLTPLGEQVMEEYLANTADAARRTSDGRVPCSGTLDGKVSVFLRSGRRRCKRRRRKMRMRAYGLDAAGTRQSAYRAKRIKIFLHIGSHTGTYV